MKAIIKYTAMNGNKAQKTIEVEKNEPNAILRTFAEAMGNKVNKWTCVSTVKCGRYEYQWAGDLAGAGVR